MRSSCVPNQSGGSCNQCEKLKRLFTWTPIKAIVANSGHTLRAVLEVLGHENIEEDETSEAERGPGPEPEDTAEEEWTQHKFKGCMGMPRFSVLGR